MLQHSSVCACPPLQRVQERYKRDFDRRLGNSRKIICAGNYVFIDVSDGVTRTSKLEHAVEVPYWVLGQDQHTLVIQSKELIERITVDWDILAPRPAGMLPIPPESVSSMGIQNKKLEGTPWFYGILDYCLKVDVQLEFL